MYYIIVRLKEWSMDAISTSHNCTELFLKASHDRGPCPAICIPGKNSVDFNTLTQMSGSIANALIQHGIDRHHKILLFEPLSAELYATILATLGIGATLIFVEPWMSATNIGHVIDSMKPSLFLTGSLGMLWGIRSTSIRKIPRWLCIKKILHHAIKTPFSLAPVPSDHPAIITFTTGTTGRPKGVVRTHQGLLAQQKVLSKVLDQQDPVGTDLCLFGNLALFNLTCGRGSVMAGKKWNGSLFKKIAELPQALQPSSVTCGPAFLQEIMKYPLAHLQSFHIGGALSDCTLLESGFNKWPSASWLHVYGSSEAEPVAYTNARQAVQLSRDRGFFQLLCLGAKSPNIEIKLEHDETWVAGPYVCPYYLGSDESNTKNKRSDAQGRVWHNMGDRLILDNNNYWYLGRSQQLAEDFALEQQLYSYLQSSKLFIYRRSNGLRVAIGEGLGSRQVDLQRHFPQLGAIVETPIVRDPRHRARIDRLQTMRTAGVRNF